MFACSSTDRPQNLLTGARHAVELGGAASTVWILTSQKSFLARRVVEFELGVEGPIARLPKTLQLRADMTHMSHGPTHTELRLDGRRYRGTIIFVMGGLWELEFFDGDALILKGQILVREN
jgi:hypothetical protein